MKENVSSITCLVFQLKQEMRVELFAFYREWTPGEANGLEKKLQVELELEPKCLNFPGQPSFHYCFLILANCC